MRAHFVILFILLACVTAGCTGNIGLVGYGTRPGVQHGLNVELINNGPSGALIVVENVSSNVISLNQSPLAVTVSVKKQDGETLADLKIPNYLHEPLMMSTMTIRTR